jgi:hypothetical protein
MQQILIYGAEDRLNHISNTIIFPQFPVLIKQLPDPGIPDHTLDLKTEGIRDQVSVIQEKTGP